MATYIFIDQEKYEDLKRAVEALRRAPEKKPAIDDPRWPKWGAFVTLLTGFALVIFTPKNPSFDLVVLVAANSVAQMFLDFLKGKWKPVLSAMARILPIVVGLANYYWP